MFPQSGLDYRTYRVRRSQGIELILVASSLAQRHDWGFCVSRWKVPCLTLHISHWLWRSLQIKYPFLTISRRKCNFRALQKLRKDLRVLLCAFRCGLEFYRSSLCSSLDNTCSKTDPSFAQTCDKLRSSIPCFRIKFQLSPSTTNSFLVTDSRLYWPFLIF